jgi:putative membrane protein
VPLLIPLAWLMMLPPAWAVGSWLSGTDRGLRFVLVSAGAFTAWDLFLDPQMVAWGYWQWATPGGYFGIPWLNFGGWFLSSALITLVARPSALPIKPLLLIYIITWLLQSIGQALFWAMPGPALVGFLVMGSFVLLTIRRGRW